jgi:hypothetical protein
MCLKLNRAELLLLYPTIFGNEEICKLILSALNCQSDDDPLLIIEWDDTSFNQANFSRDHDPTHTVNSLIQYIKNSGGIDLEDKHIAFMFKNGGELSRCVYGFPTWYGYETFTYFGFN